MGLEWVRFEAQFQLGERLSASEFSTVYQGEFGGGPAIIRLARRTPDSLLSFRREAALLQLLRHSMAPTFFEVGEVAQQVYLAMSYIEGRSLRAHLRTEARWSVTQVLGLLKDILRVLEVLHRNNYIHRDIKPENIIIDPSGAAHLIDYHSALHAQASDEVVEVGTLAYSAPEQTGMLARPLDPRADLYALGVVAYECLVGTLPFVASREEELAQLHASSPAPPLDAALPEAPPWLTALLARCLAKDPHDRFSHAAQLLALLEKLEVDAVVQSVEAWTREFALGESASPAPTFGELPFVGRQEEIESFQELWQGEAGQEKGVLVLIEAPPGAGKSRLSQELLKLAAAECSDVVKCVRESTVPLAPWRKVLQRCWFKLQSMPGARRDAVERQLRTSLLTYAPLLLELAPVWGALWPALPDQSAQAKATRELYYTMLSDLWREIAQVLKGTVLVFDDVQWMDLGSLEVLRRLVHQCRDTPLCLIATSRNDPDSLEGLESFRDACDADLGIALAPLTRDDVVVLCEQFLGATPDDDLLGFLWEESKGSPFALQQYLKVLIDEGLLWPAREEWCFDVEATASLALPHDIAGLLLHRIDQLAPDSVEALRFTAALGYHSDFALLKAIGPFDEDALAAAISEAMHHQLMQQDGGRYRFSHNRIHEAFLASNTPTELRKLHLHIAQGIEAKGLDQGPLLFACARHYLACVGAGDALEAALDLPHGAISSVCMRAGTAALDAYAEQEAFVFLEGALAAHQAALSAPPPMLFYNLAAAGFRLGKIEQAHTHLRTILSRATDPVMRAKTHYLLAELHIMDYHPNLAEVEVQLAFRELQVSPPANDLWGLFRVLYAWCMGLLMLRTGWGVGAAKDDEAEKQRLLLALYETSSRTSFFQMRDFEFLQCILSMFYIAHRLGEPADLVRAYNAYGLLMGSLSKPDKVLHYRDLALAQAGDDRPLLARTTIYAHWGINFAATDPGLTQKFSNAFSTHGHLMDPFERANCSAVLEMALSTHGYMEEAEKVALQCIQQLKLNNERITEHRALHGPLHTLAIACSSLGRRAEAQKSYQEAQALLRLEPDSRYTQCWALGASAQMYLELHDFGPQFEEVCEAHKHFAVNPAQAPIFLRFFFVYQVMARALQFIAASPAARADLRPRLDAAHEALKRASNRPFFEMFGAYVAGAIAFAQGELETASHELRRANELALLWDNPMLQCEALLLLAQTFQLDGLFRQSQEASKQAYDLARRHHWQVRSRRILQLFPLATAAIDFHLERGHHTTQVAAFSSLRFKRHMNALLQINLASTATREPARRAQAILEQLVDLLGAERACLFMMVPGQDEESDTLALVAEEYAHSAIVPTNTVTHDSVAIEHVQRTREPYLHSLPESDASQEGERRRSIIAAPLLMDGSFRGIVYLDSQLVSGLFHQEDAEILQALANHIAIAMDAAEAADTLAIAHDEALTANRAKSLFLATMSHELRTPLNAILGYSELLVDEFGSTLPDEVSSDINAIHTAGRRLFGIIEDVLSLTALETARFVIQPSAFAPAELLQEIAEDLSSILNTRHHQLEWQLPDPPIEMVSDRHKCRQILFHILHNAARFTEGGTIQLSLERQGEQWLFCITDDGIGIDEDDLAHIFLPFFQADMSHSREHDGTGMGLAVAQRFCHALGGTIEVQSKRGKGSTFRVSIPQLSPDDSF